jgi:hypothetical protein
MAMKKLHLIAVISFISVLLTGCVKMDLALEINSDKTVSGTMIYAISDALSEFGSTSEESDPTTDLFDTSAKGVTISEYKQDGYTGTKIVLDRVPMEAFNKEGGDTGGFQISREENRITLKGELDLSSADTSEAEDSEWGAALAKTLFATADLDISVKFPVKVLSTTGTISEDGRTVSWKPQLGEKVDLTTTVELPTKNFILAGIFAGIVALVAAALFMIMKARRKKINVTSDSADESNFTI